VSNLNDNKLQKRPPSGVVEKGQYALAFVVVAAMLVVAGFPAFVVFFFGIFAYFLWKIFTSGSRSETRDIFEFYLAANEMLRDDDRRWYGFEIRDVISRGVRIVQSMSAAPPLVYFTLGALFNKVGEHKEAVANLKNALESEHSDEMNFVFPSPELRNYVKVLRKIEREPAEAPMTSAAVRSLERARRLRGKSLLEESRAKMEQTVEVQPPQQLNAEKPEASEKTNGQVQNDRVPVSVIEDRERESSAVADRPDNNVNKRRSRSKEPNERFGNRKPISEVLHDIYDDNTH
jgi:hypothetical protein